MRTLPIKPRGPLLRLDPATGKLCERRYRLQVVQGPDKGTNVALTGNLVVGTGVEAGLRLTDRTVSTHHLELSARADGVYVRDLDSKNGTFLGGARVREAIAEQEAVLSVGRSQLKLSLVEEGVGELGAPSAFGSVQARSKAMRHLFAILKKAAPTDSTVLLQGETGTGKELLARAIHEESRRSEGPWVVFDCASTSDSLIESELFGHKKGAFTGAVEDREGAFLGADGGTLFLDEIGELPLGVQPRLLRALEGGLIKRVGEDEGRRVDVRVVAASHRDLQKRVVDKKFREDLYYRLAVVQLRVPPLRERREDVSFFAQAFVRELSRGGFVLTKDLEARLEEYHWPGNVRELRNVVARALACGEVEIPQPASIPLPAPEEGALGALPLKEAKDRLVEAFERAYLTQLLAKHRGNVTAVAKAAGLNRTYLHRLLERYGLKAKGG